MNPLPLCGNNGLAASRLRRFGSETIDAVEKLPWSIEAMENLPRLELLRRIEKTLNVNAHLESKMCFLIDHAQMLLPSLRKETANKPLDASGEACEALLKAERSLAGFTENLSKCVVSARADNELVGDYEESVVTSFERVITVLAELHNTLSEIRWTVLEHDADLEEATGKPFSSVQELMESLKN